MLAATRKSVMEVGPFEGVKVIFGGSKTLVLDQSSCDWTLLGYNLLLQRVFGIQVRSPKIPGDERGPFSTELTIIYIWVSQFWGERPNFLRRSG